MNGDQTTKQIFKNFANKLNKAKTKAEKICFENYSWIIQTMQEKPGNWLSWKFIPFNKPKTVYKKIDRLIYNDQELVENQQIAEKFNEHFTSIGIVLTNKIHFPANFFRKFQPKRVTTSI